MLRLLRNERGSALAFAVLTTLVLMVLGTATLSMSSSEAKHSIKNEKQVQADYIAKAGADITAKQIIANPSSPTNGLNGNIGDGTYTTTVTYPDDSTAKIVSTGVVDGSVAQVTLDMNGGTYQNLFTGIQQTGDHDLDLTALGITYEDGATVSIEANVDSLDDIDLSTKKPNNADDPNIITAINNTPLPSFELPDSTSFKTSLPEIVEEGKGKDKVETMTFIGNYKLTTLSVTKEKVIFDTQGTDQHIIVNTLDVQAHGPGIEVKGGGAVHLYILDFGDIQTPVSVNSSDPGTLFIYVADGKSLSLQANGEITAYIYGPSATILMTSDHTTVNGAIVGELIKKNGTQGPMGNFHYIPLEDEPVDPPIETGYSKTSYH